MHKILIWDFPTRLFHWLLVLNLGFQFVTAEILDDAMQWHFYGGYSLLSLLIFRVLWGVFGACYARFSEFLVGPKKALHYAKSLAFHDTPIHAGHNPMGALAIIFILGVLFLQTISGLFISDDIFHQGPYHSMAPLWLQNTANWLHGNLFNAVWVFLIFHLGAMLFYKLEKQQNLVAAMFTGYKWLPYIVPHSKHMLWRALLLACVSGVLVYLLVVYFAPDIIDDYYY